MVLIAEGLTCAQGDFAFILHDSRTRQVSLLEATCSIEPLYDGWLHDLPQ